MLKNYLKTALRNLLRFKVYSAINIIGLSVGIAACLLIFLYVQNDLGFDKFNKNYDRIYRVVQESKQDGRDVTWSITPTGYAGAFVNDFPGVESVRLSRPDLYKPIVKYDDQLYSVDDFIFADSSFFRIFTFPLLEGNPNTALSEPFSLVLSQGEAKKIFGNTDPMGKTLRVMNRLDFKVTGVAKDPPYNSSIQFKYLASFISLKDISKRPGILNDFHSSNFYTFLLLPSGLQTESIQNDLSGFVDKYLGEGSSKETKLLLQPLSNIHFNQSYLFDFPNKGDIQNDYILSTIAFVILLIACANFVNISTARSATRAKEVGLRKVLGADRSQIVWQFTLEFVALMFVSLIFAIVLVELLLPAFNSLSGKQLVLNFFGNPRIVVSFLAVWLSVISVACAYPSVYLSSFQPTVIFKGSFRSDAKGSHMRGSLIVFQFAVVISLIIITVITSTQYYFLKSHKLGFDGEQVMFTPSNPEISKNYEAFKTQLLQRSGIRYVSRANWIPGHPIDIETYSWMGKSGSRSDDFYSLIVDPDYVKALGLKFAAGRNFSWQMPSDWSDSYILNETAAKTMGWTPTEAIGQSLASWHHNGRVVGVVKDFNFRSLRQGIEPIVMLMDSSSPASAIIVKMSPQNTSGILTYIRTKWKQFSTDFPFDYHFLDQDFEQLYESERRLSEVLGSFSTLSILIGCLGLFGLASHATQQRTKEVSIRKVLGASVPQITKLMMGDFLKLVLIANIIAWPLAYYVMNEWLQNFAYRIDVGLWIFVLSGVLASVIALLTVGSQAIRAATANPVESLRYE